MRHFSRARLDRAFEPGSVAVVGAMKVNDFIWLRKFLNPVFKGRLVSVHVNPESIREIEARGVPNYRRVTDIPGPVDYVVVNTSRRYSVDIFRQCIEADVGAVSYFTSGFAETDEEGATLQQTLAAMSRESGVPLLGPNCTGIYNPAFGMPTQAGMPVGEAGPVGMVSQSGTHASYFAKALAAWHDLREARGISFGNAAVLDAADWFEYIGEDDRVGILASYLETIGDRDAGDYDRFVAALRRVTSRKPVVIWKGGNTADGARIAGNHTGSRPVSPDDWAWVLRSTGAIGVGSMEELTDTTAAIAKLKEPKGPRCGLLILTGGQGIAIGDAFGRRGLRVPALSQASLDELATFFDPIGGSFRNPLDAAYTTETPAMLARELRILDEDPNTDFVVMDLFSTIMSPRRLASNFGVGLGHVKDIERKAGETFLDVLRKQFSEGRKPFFAIVTPAETEREGLELREMLRGAGVLAFNGVERAAAAYANVLRYWADRRAGRPGD